MQSELRTYHLKIDPSGRMVLPAEVRTRHHISSDETIVVTDDGRSLHVRTKAQILSEAQDYFRSFVPDGVSLVDELLEDRRAEAEREQRGS